MGARHMEALGTIDTVVLDKTGMLTYGEPYVVAVNPCPGADSAQLLKLAANAERPSGHPVAKAIFKEATRRKAPLSDLENFECFPGKGVRALWNGEEILVGDAALLSGIPDFDSQLGPLQSGERDVLIACRGKLVGTRRTNDILRPEATARRCRRIICFNFAATFVVDTVGMALAAISILTPLLAAIVHGFWEMAFILNSARLVPTAGVKRRV
jgi:cation transport ATPase